jgi:hypothetical protein
MVSACGSPATKAETPHLDRQQGPGTRDCPCPPPCPLRSLLVQSQAASFRPHGVQDTPCGITNDTQALALMARAAVECNVLDLREEDAPMGEQLSPQPKLLTC